MTPALVLAALLTPLGAVALGAVALVRRRYVSVDITGGSMRPTYDDGDRVLVRRVPPRRLRTGDVVVLAEPSPRKPEPGSGAGERWLIKRVAALPGDPVPRHVPALATAAGERVPTGSVVVLGDGGARSYDSKQLGYLPLESVLGVAVRTLTRAHGRR
ncbi:S26 family signal peptidase [Virgisporangium aliadipatigenens]|uniref:S26 family signal peptidase n=1 Tax=Virgisporangium aliadipatigenens TaxID=741659 RepID=A0A8J3YT34_9ACTN|nr:S26 family signal peptidase [Virgisporangium aliadipatigenens]GIJ49326.1 S26 family signal peptidase [Virgisporangium aliadipatigenens]